MAKDNWEIVIQNLNQLRKGYHITFGRGPNIIVCEEKPISDILQKYLEESYAQTSDNLLGATMQRQILGMHIITFEPLVVGGYVLIGFLDKGDDGIPTYKYDVLPSEGVQIIPPLVYLDNRHPLIIESWKKLLLPDYKVSIAPNSPDMRTENNRFADMVKDLSKTESDTGE